MADIRERVQEDRGILKRIQLLIPGFAGYRRREDFRQADSLLRVQLATGIAQVGQRLESARGDLVANYRMREMEPLGAVIMKLKAIEGQVRHAEQGYSGFSAALQVKENELDHLYEFDLSLLEGIKALGAQVDALGPMVADTNADLRGAIVALGRKVDDLGNTFRRRMNIVTNSEAT